MSRSHAFHPMCGCAQCCRTERAMERDDEMREEYRDLLAKCPDFVSEQCLEDDAAKKAAQAIADGDDAELGRIFRAAVLASADWHIADRVERDGMTPGEAAERLYEVYRPDMPSNGDLAAREAA